MMNIPDLGPGVKKAPDPHHCFHFNAAESFHNGKTFGLENRRKRGQIFNDDMCLLSYILFILWYNLRSPDLSWFEPIC